MSAREFPPEHWNPRDELTEPAQAPAAPRPTPGPSMACSACGGSHTGERPLRDRLRCIAAKMRWAEVAVDRWGRPA